jgi:hypothetical protein
MSFDSAVQDESCTPKTVTNGGVTTAASPAKWGRSAYFNGGASTYFTVPDSTDLQLGGGDFTVMFWLYPTVIPAGGYQDILLGKGSGLVGWYLAFQSDGATMYLSATDNTFAVSFAHGMSVNNWYHLALVRSAGTTTVYVNGVSKGSTTQAMQEVTGSALRVGGWYYNGNYPYNGYLDDLVIRRAAVDPATLPPSSAYHP